MRTRFVDGAALADCDVPIAEGTVDFNAPLDLVSGPTCRFAVDGRILSGVVHHALFDGASNGILCERLLDADAPAPRRTLRDYAAWETEQDGRVGDWVELLGDAEPRFAGTPEAVANETATVQLDGATVGRIRAWCQAKGIGVFAFALWATRHLLRAYGDVETCALGVAYDVRPASLRRTVGMMVNTVLVPLEGLSDATALHQRWVNDVLPMARTPFDSLVASSNSKLPTPLPTETPPSIHTNRRLCKPRRPRATAATCSWRSTSAWAEEGGQTALPRCWKSRASRRRRSSTCR